MTESVRFERGWHVRGTPLWFDAERRRELCVLTGCESRLPPAHKRVIASAPLAAALTQAGYKGPLLPSPWQRPLGLGGQTVHLIDAGAPIGGAAALVVGEGPTILMLGLMRRYRGAWPKAAILAARLPALGHTGLSVRDGAVALAKVLRRDPAGPPMRLYVEHVEVALALLPELAALGCALIPRGLVGRLAPKPDKEIPVAPVAGSIALAPNLEANRYKGSAPTVFVDTGLGHGEGLCAPDVVPVGYFADASALSAAVALCHAKTLHLVDVPRALQVPLRRALGHAVTVKFVGAAQQLALA